MYVFFECFFFLRQSTNMHFRLIGDFQLPIFIKVGVWFLHSPAVSWNGLHSFYIGKHYPFQCLSMLLMPSGDKSIKPAQNLMVDLAVFMYMENASYWSKQRLRVMLNISTWESVICLADVTPIATSFFHCISVGWPEPITIAHLLCGTRQNCPEYTRISRAVRSLMATITPTYASSKCCAAIWFPVKPNNRVGKKNSFPWKTGENCPRLYDAVDLLQTMQQKQHLKFEQVMRPRFSKFCKTAHKIHCGVQRCQWITLTQIHLEYCFILDFLL